MTNFLSMKRASVVDGFGVYKGQGACLSIRVPYYIGYLKGALI